MFKRRGAGARAMGTHQALSGRSGVVMSNRTRILFALGIAAAVCGSDPSSAEDTTPAQPATKSAPTSSAVANAVDPVIRRALAEEGIPGAAFVFVHADRVV
jgi:CubicO group peptidase (beta-lactamase class C family)